MAAAGQMLKGAALYRGIWFDKPPLWAAYYLLSGARPGWPVRLEGACYWLLCCWIVYAFGRDLWSRREGVWAAALLGFFSVFYLPAAVIPVASDLLMLAPHVAAVWMAWKRRALWSGVLAGIAFWINPKGVFVLAACLLWYPAGALAIAAGFAVVSGLALAYLWATGSVYPFWQEVWVWGRLYASDTFISRPVWNGIGRTLNWAGFHIAAVVAAIYSVARQRRAKPHANEPSSVLWIGWAVIAFAGVAAGLRFFPRYYFLLLPIVILMAARGFTLLGRRAVWVALLLAIPLVRFAPSYARAWNDPEWRDVQMDRDSHAAAVVVGKLSRPGDTLLVWGYRPEIFPYTGLRAATMFLDSQPLSGVPADRHLTDSTPVETVNAARLRAELTTSRPTFIVDGIAAFNPRLSIDRYPELAPWLGQYQLAARTTETLIYKRK